jgi:S-adenosylmethionine synthetase
MSGIIRIDMPKGVQEGSTSVSPTSPNAQLTATGSPPISRTGAIMIGYSAMAAKAVYNTAVQEIRAGGNEELATTLENATTATGIIVGAIATKGLSLIPLGISAGTQLFTREKANQRKNRAIDYERSMRGSRVSYQQGGSYE